MNNKKPTFSAMNSNDDLEFNHLASTTQSDSTLSTFLMGAAVIVIVSSVTFVGTIVMSSGELHAGVKNSQKSDYFAGETTPIARAYEKTLYRSTAAFGAIAGVNANLKVNKTDVGLDAIDSELHEACLKPNYPNEANDVARLGKISLHPRKAAKYISCTMDVQKSRLCENYYSKRLAKRLNHVIQKEVANKAYVKRMLGGNSMGATANRRMVAFSKSIKKAENKGISSGTNKGPIISATVGAQITELTKHGLLSKSDFGLGIFSSIPPEIEKYMVEQTIEVCPSSWF